MSLTVSSCVVLLSQRSPSASAEYSGCESGDNWQPNATLRPILAAGYQMTAGAGGQGTGGYFCAAEKHRGRLWTIMSLKC